MSPAYLDSSALVVILNEEPGCNDLLERIKSREGICITSPISVYEATTSIAGRHPTSDQFETARKRVYALLDVLEAEIVACDAGSLSAALDHYFEIISQTRFADETSPFILGSSFAFAVSKRANAEVIHVGNPFLE